MKRIKLLLIMAIAANFAVAQNTNVVNAYNYNRDAQTEIKLAETLKAQNKADKAAKRMDGAKTLMGKSKAAIDQASTHESTQSQPKTWHYYGITYYMIGTYPELSDLDPNAYDKSLNAFIKVKQLDEKYYKDNQMDIASHIISIADNYFNNGTLSFNDGNYADAAAKYLNAFEAKKAINVTDEGALTNAALSFYKAQQFDKAIEAYQQVANLGKEDAYTYYYMAECYRNLENKDKMIEIVNVGRQKFPENNDLINEQINAYLNAKREVEIIDQIKEMAENNSDQPIYYFILGNIYGNAESTLFNIDEAVACYDKAITADINYADAYINVGSLYIDQAAGLYKNAEDVWEDKKLDFNAQMKASDEYTEQGKAFDEKAMPYVEKAHELLPDDEAIKQALRGIYTRLKLTEKAAGLN